MGIDPDDSIALINNERTFILGLYENPEDDAVLKEVAAAGFNLVHAQASTESLDRLHAHGLYGWLNTGMAINTPLEDLNAALALKVFIESFKDHPALVVWEVPDEALWNTWYAAQLWRHNEEPGVLKEKIAALGDDLQKETLLADLEQSRALNRAGEYQQAEGLADALWDALGEPSPKPNLGLANAQERADKLLSGMLMGYQFLKSADNIHPVWMNHAPRNSIDQLAAFNTAASIVGCDIYPVPMSDKVGHSDLNNRSLSCVGDYTRRMQAAAPGKPVWMVLQGFGWKDLGEDRPEELRRPTKAETRFMAWDAIINGATGILYWGTAYIEKDSTLWKELLEVVRELADAQDILTAPSAELPSAITLEPTYGSLDSGVRGIQKQVGDKTVMLVANEGGIPLTFTISRLDTLEGLTYQARQYENAHATITNGKLTLTIPPFSIYILEPAN